MSTLFHHSQRFSIRKYTVGVASVLVGTALLAGAQSVSADEVIAAQPEVVLVESTEQLKVTPAPNPTEPTLEVVTDVSEPAAPEVVTPVLGDNSADGATAQQPETAASAVTEGVTVAPDQTKEDSVLTNQGTPDEALESVDLESGKEPLREESEKPAPGVENALVRGVQTRAFSADVDAKPMTRTAFRNAGRSTLIGDNYKWKYAAIPYKVVDDWGLYARECTSFTAFRLSTVNGFDLPRAYGDAGSWGYRAQREGYRVDMTPAKGSVAWFGPSAFGSNVRYGHVAWVANVYGDKVEIEEYNLNENKRYNTRIINRTEVSGYIHFKDLATTVKPISTPTVPSTLPSSGQYTFTSRVSVKGEPKQSAPELAFYNAGSTVNYDSKLEADGYQWISYVNYQGGRSYIAISPAQATAPAPSQPQPAPVTTVTIPSSGTYTFTKQ